jgi:hypothetical protein
MRVGNQRKGEIWQKKRRKGGDFFIYLKKDEKIGGISELIRNQNMTDFAFEHAT